MQQQHAPSRPTLPRLSHQLWKDRTPATTYGLTILLAVFFIWHLLPSAFLLGQSGFFEQIDASQHVAGWLFYAHDNWHFPLLHTNRLNHPEGINIAFTDSIPLAAILLKTIAHWLPAHFHYIGMWHAMAFITQALAATFLIRSLGLRHLLATISAVLLAITWPALLWRFGHTALMTHGIVLLGLAFYFLGRHGQWRSNLASNALIALCVAGLLIHPYFLAFCYALFLAFLADQALSGERWKKQAGHLLISIVVLCIVGVVFGYFGNNTTTSGFGYYSMNASAPFCGGRFFSCVTDHAHHPFEAFHFADATDGQYEGYNYFGAGVFLLLPFAIASHWRTLITLPKRYPALTIVLVLFTIYALSNHVYWNAHEILSYPLPSFLGKLTGTFRSSGRFFWIVGYLVLFLVLLALLKTPSWQAVLLMAIALLLQWFDVQPLQQRIMTLASAPAKHDLDAWKKVMANVDKIHLYPAFGCDEKDVNLYWLFQRLAAQDGKLLDTGYIARPHQDCQRNRHLFEIPFLPRHLYIMSEKEGFSVPASFDVAAQRGECVKWQQAILCQPGRTHTDWPNLTVKPLTTFKALTWSADNLPTEIGVLRNGRLVPAHSNKTGFLSFGPYLTLPAGRYHYAIDYASDTASVNQVGRWDAIISGNRTAAHELASGFLSGSNRQISRIDGTLIIDHAQSSLEIRTFFNGNGDLQLMAISLEKIS